MPLVRVSNGGSVGASFVLTGRTGGSWFAQISVNAIKDKTISHADSSYQSSWTMTFNEFTFTKYGGSNNLYITSPYDCKFYNTSGLLVANIAKNVATNVGIYDGFIVPD